MKKTVALILITLMVTACNNANEAESEEVDSLQERKNELLETIDSSYSEKIDSLKEKRADLKKTFDSAYSKAIDSVKKK